MCEGALSTHSPPPSGSSSPAGDTHLLYGILLSLSLSVSMASTIKRFSSDCQRLNPPTPPPHHHHTPHPRSSATTASQEQPILIFIPHTLISSVQSKENEYSMKCSPFSSSTHSSESLRPEGSSWPLRVFPFTHRRIQTHSFLTVKEKLTADAAVSFQSCFFGLAGSSRTISASRKWRFP